MKLKATHRFRASPETVFAALNDPEILRQAIGGCEELVPAGDDVFEARVRIGIGAIKGTYKGTVQLRNKKPPESFTLAMKGQGSGGFVNGSADIRLRAQDGGTELEAEADAIVGGTIAAVGSRLVEVAARKMMVDFFQRLADQIDPRTSA